MLGMGPLNPVHADLGDVNTVLNTAALWCPHLEQIRFFFFNSLFYKHGTDYQSDQKRYSLFSTNKLKDGYMTCQCKANSDIEIIVQDNELSYKS